MKLLTLNTHSIIENNYFHKTEIFIDALSRIQPDIIAMQEVNQTMSEPVIALGDTFNVRSDNHAYKVAQELNYTCLWHGIKIGYGKYEEGIALLSRLPVTDTHVVSVSRATDPMDWRCRSVLGAKINGEWFYSVHLGWYDDTDDPFSEQWQKLIANIHSDAWLMGDFNCDADSRGYNEVIASGWHDAYTMAADKDSGVTVKGKIDGWRDKNAADMRLDYVFTNRARPIRSSKVIFNGINEEVVSDHYGVVVEV